jgi:hypothetical protein
METIVQRLEVNPAGEKGDHRHGSV